MKLSSRASANNTKACKRTKADFDVRKMRNSCAEESLPCCHSFSMAIERRSDRVFSPIYFCHLTGSFEANRSFTSSIFTAGVKANVGSPMQCDSR